MIKLFEHLKKSFVTDQKSQKTIYKLSNNPDVNVDIATLTDDPLGGAVNINMTNQQDYNYFGDTQDQFHFQNAVIRNYRELAGKPDISTAINIIVNEMVWTIDPKVFKISIDEENDKIKEVINEEFKNVLNLLNIRDNIFTMARELYIDGQLNIALAYDTRDIKKGITQAKIVEPINLYFDREEKLWKYKECVEDNFLYSSIDITDENKDTFTESEMVHVDFGMYAKKQTQTDVYRINIGYLESVGRVANMLETLENMLVPFRYSRSVSRRLFNIDVADLPPKQAKEVMNTIRAEFKYKKSYDPATGTIKNINGTQPLVEDYWMSNRGGAKGTTVDTMDERGAALDLEDIKHAAKKLYSAMNIPEEFNPYSDDQGSFRFDDTEVTQSLLKFYIFVSRLRIPLVKLIKEILRRQLVAKGIFKDGEWKEYEKKIEIQFTAESVFIDNMQKELFLKGVEQFVNIKENIGKSISLQTAAENSFGWSTEQLDEELKKIEEERANPLYVNFYARDEEGDTQGGSWR